MNRSVLVQTRKSAGEKRPIGQRPAPSAKNHAAHKGRARCHETPVGGKAEWHRGLSKGGAARRGESPKEGLPRRRCAPRHAHQNHHRPISGAAGRRQGRRLCLNGARNKRRCKLLPRRRTNRGPRHPCGPLFVAGSCLSVSSGCGPAARRRSWCQTRSLRQQTPSRRREPELPKEGSS